MVSGKKTSESTVRAKRKIRYAVIGEGYISQAAVLPAFAHATSNSELRALVSGDPVKLKSLARSTTYHTSALMKSMTTA